jgi:peptidoglycan/xylan/chitin deacetylase (PgdA/CDA1 family)
MQLRFYKKYFDIVSLEEFYRLQPGAEKFTISLTFDDGFANNYKYVLPLLEQYEVPATFFITAIRDAGYDILWNDMLAIAAKYGPERIFLGQDLFIKTGKGRYRSSTTDKFLVDTLRTTGFDAKKEMIQVLASCKAKADRDYWLQMTIEEIKNLSQNKWVTIGSHGYYHNDLSQISIDLVKDELSRSKRFLESITGKRVTAVAFPYGAYTPETIKAAKQTGYTQLLTAGSRYKEDKTDELIRDRFTVNPFISTVNQMHANISGSYE